MHSPELTIDATPTPTTASIVVSDEYKRLIVLFLIVWWLCITYRLTHRILKMFFSTVFWAFRDALIVFGLIVSPFQTIGILVVCRGIISTLRDIYGGPHDRLAPSKYSLSLVAFHSESRL
jgi:hypothetical protein